MPIKQKVLAQLPLFCHFNAGELLEISLKMQERRAEAGTRMIAQGDNPGLPLFILVYGKVVITKQNVDGRKQILQNLSAPNIFGETEILASTPAKASVVALESVQVWTLCDTSVRALCAAARPCMLKLLQALRYNLSLRNLALKTCTQQSGQSANDSPTSLHLGTIQKLLYASWY